MLFLSHRHGLGLYYNGRFIFEYCYTRWLVALFISRWLVFANEQELPKGEGLSELRLDYYASRRWERMV